MSLVGQSPGIVTIGEVAWCVANVTTTSVAAVCSLLAMSVKLVMIELSQYIPRHGKSHGKSHALSHDIS
jgi:hypothetical protein